MPDPVAWTMVERGWKVYGAGGDEIGGDQGVLDVVLEAIFRGAYHRDAALGPTAVAQLHLVLGDQQHLLIRGHFFIDHPTMFEALQRP